MATYGEVTRRIRSELSSDRSFTDESLLDAVTDSMRDIAKRCVPLSLVCQGNVEPLFRWIDDVNFIRTIAVPSGTLIEEIDIDDLLREAVVFGSCKVLSRDRKGDYHTLMLQEINNYNWAIYEGESNVADLLTDGY